MVYVAQDTILGRKLAIKMLPAEVADSPEKRENLEREVRTNENRRHLGYGCRHGSNRALVVHAHASLCYFQPAEGRALFIERNEGRCRGTLVGSNAAEFSRAQLDEPLEARRAVAVRGEHLWKHFDSDFALEPGVSASIHFTLARGNRGDDLTRTESSSWVNILRVRVRSNHHRSFKIVITWPPSTW